GLIPGAAVKDVRSVATTDAISIFCDATSPQLQTPSTHSTLHRSPSARTSPSSERMDFVRTTRWMRSSMMRRPRIAALAAVIAMFIAIPASADPIADFYGRTRITFLVGAGPAGGYDLYSRVFAEHVSRHIPGHPSIIVQNMQGAGGLRAADYLANVAPKDGSV